MSTATMQSRHLKLVRAQAAAGAAFGHAYEDGARPRRSATILAAALAVALSAGAALAGGFAFVL